MPLLPLLRCAAALLFPLAWAAGARAASVGQDVARLAFERVEAADDLLTGGVTSLAQDGAGFVWIGTRDGLLRFDGREFKVFQSDGGSAGSIGHDDVVCLAITRSGALWVGASRGLSRYDRQRERFVNYLPRGEQTAISGIGETSEGAIFAVSEGGILYRLDAARDEFVAVSDRALGIAKSMLVDARDRIWVGGDKGLFLLDSEANLVDRIPLPPKESPTDFVYVTALAEAPDGRLWFGANRGGVYVWDPATRAATPLPGVSAPNLSVRSIEIDDAGNAFVGAGLGLVVVDASTGAARRYEADELDPRAVPPGAGQALLIDRQGSLWIGTDRGALAAAYRRKRFHSMERTPGDENGLSRARVSSVYQDSRDELWVGYYRGGYDVFAPDGRKLRSHQPKNGESGGVGEGAVWDIVEDARGAIWIGTNWTGLHRLDPETRAARRFAPDPSAPGSIGGSDIRRLLAGADGSLWVAVHGVGVERYDPASGRFERLPLPERLWVEDLARDNAGNLWVGSSDGLHRVSPSGEVRRYAAAPDDPRALIDRHVKCLLFDSSGALWVGTEGGLCILDLETESFRQFGLSDGFSSQAIRSIVEDGAGHVWIGAARGLYRWDGERLAGYTTADGLLSNGFTERAVVETRAGELIFGLDRGIARFFPESIQPNDQPPPVVITAFRVFNETVSPGPDSPLRESIQTVRRIELPPGAHSFSFEFAALNFINPERNRFACRLEGFDPDWAHIGARRSCFYTNIDPGRYRFRVIASNGDGVWNEIGASVDVVVRPWFWQTSWFMGICLVSLAAAPVGVFWIRTRGAERDRRRLEDTVAARTAELREALKALEAQKARIGAQNEELIGHRENLSSLVRERTEQLAAAKERAEQSDRMKSAFLANISHEIRTPMNAIMGFVQLIGRGGLRQDEVASFSSVIVRNGEALLVLLNDILDLSRLEAGAVTIDDAPCDIAQLMEDLLLYCQSQLEKRGRSGVRIVYRMPAAGRNLRILVDCVRLRQILSNLLENALKFTPKGEVTFGYELAASVQGEPRIQFFVSDTGIGIPKEKLDLVFERFEKLEDARGKLYAGAGLGLSIAQKLAELMGGEISVESEPGVGSTFTVDLPCRFAPPEEEAPA